MRALKYRLQRIQATYLSINFRSWLQVVEKPQKLFLRSGRPKRRSRANLAPSGLPKRRSSANLAPSGLPNRRSSAILAPFGLPKRRSRTNLAALGSQSAVPVPTWRRSRVNLAPKTLNFIEIIQTFPKRCSERNESKPSSISCVR